jgi:hypothetical protein
MKRKLKLLFLFSLFLFTTSELHSQVIVQLKVPPPGKLNVENLWSVTLKNTSQNTVKVFMMGTLAEATDGLIFRGITREFDLAPGSSTLSVSDVSPISSTFPKQNYKDILIQTGEVPSGNYNICLTVQTKEGSTLGTQCINNHIVNNVSGITLISPENNSNISEKNPNFSWAPLTGTGNQYKFILAEKNGTPQQSLQTPEFEITQSATFLVYPVSASSLLKGKTYYWQVALLDYKGDVLTSSKSEIRSFKVPEESTPPVADGFIQLLTPSDDGTLDVSQLPGINNTTYAGYKFTWKKANTNKSITKYILKLYKAKTTGRENLDNQTPDFTKDITGFNYNAEIQSTSITVEMGILDKGSRYFWKVEAFSQAYINQNNGIVGRSDHYEFKVIGGEDLAGDVKKFKIGKYDVNVTKVVNKSPSNFEGEGTVQLWAEGPNVKVTFDNLIIKNISNTWSVTSGFIQKALTGDELKSIKLEHTETQSKFFPKTISLKTDDASLQGYILTVFPLTKKASGFQLINVNISSAETWFKIDPVQKLSIDNLLGKNDENAMLLEPAGFELNLLQLKTFFTVKNNKLTLKLGGNVGLPDYIKYGTGDKVKISFNDQSSLKFAADLGAASFTVPLNKNKDLSLYITNVVIDLVPKDTWKGGIRINKGKIYFPVNSGFNDIQLDGNNILGDMYINAKGLTAKTDITGMSYKSKFYGFDCDVNKFYLDVKNGALVKCNFKGGIFIPMVGLNLNYVIPITDNAIGPGTLDLTNTNLGEIYLFGNNSSEYDRLKISLNSAVIKQGKVVFQSNLTLDNTNSDPKKKNLSTGTMNAYNFYVTSTAQIGFEESENITGHWLALDNYTNADYNGYDVTLTKLRFNNIGSGNYSFEVKGKIILAEDLSGPGGSDFGLTYPFYRNPLKGGSGSEISYANEVKSDAIIVTYTNSQSTYTASIEYKNDDTYGTAFLASFNMTMHNPTEYSVGGKLILGKAPQGFKYWFVEAGAEFPETPVAIGIGDLGVYGFKGRIYSKMKHQGIGVGNTTYVPDGGTTFGVYAEVPFMSTTDDGYKIWGKTSLEVVIGNGFTSTLTGDVYILAGRGNTNAKIYGSAVIQVVIQPSQKFFSADLYVNADLDGAVCGSGNLGLYFGSDTWYLNVGNPQTPVTMNIYCGNTVSTAYINLNPQNIAFGMGYSVDTGPQTWAIFYGRAWGSVAINGALAYSPFQFTGGAVITGGAELGFHYDVYFDEGNLTVLSGAITATLQAQLPNPVCFAGSVSAKGCFWRFCKTVTLKMRYKNGSFAFEDHC